MSQAGSWNEISEADSNRVILAVDFPAPGRVEGNFADLAAKLGPGYRFLSTVPPPGASPEQRITAEAYTRQWIQDIRRHGWQVVAVLGYCVGSVYAAAIVESISEWQDTAPKSMLFDPTWVTASMVPLEARKIISKFGALLSEDEVELARNRTEELLESESGDVADAAIACVGLYREIGSTLFGRLGLDSVRRDEIIRLFESYMSWASVAGQIDPRRVWKCSTAILSAEYANEASSAGGANTSNGIFANEIILDVSHSDLLGSDYAAKAVLGQVEDA
jgi:hypothetical protein